VFALEGDMFSEEIIIEDAKYTLLSTRNLINFLIISFKGQKDTCGYF